MISIVLAESSLELVPYELQSHPSVTLHAQKLDKDPSGILLDNSWHYASMKGINNELKRGRPDLVHFSILEATTIPLYFQNRIRLFIHTIDDKVIQVKENVRIPKSYHRFAGLIEKLFREKTVKANGQELLSVRDQSFRELIDDLNPTQIVGLSTAGKPSTFEKVSAGLSDDSCIVIGGFQKGHFSEPTTNKFTELFSVGDTSLDAHIVVSRLLYEYEKTIFM